MYYDSSNCVCGKLRNRSATVFAVVSQCVLEVVCMQYLDFVRLECGGQQKSVHVNLLCT